MICRSNDNPGREKIGKICKISGEKLVFSPQIPYIVLRWNAVKLCKFTARVSGELTKSPRFRRSLHVTLLARIRTSHLLHVSHFFFHCATSPSHYTPGLKFLCFHTRIIYDLILSILDFLSFYIWSFYDYQEIIYDPSTNTKNHTSSFCNSLTIYIFLILFGRASPKWYPGITLWSAKRP